MNRIICLVFVIVTATFSVGQVNLTEFGFEFQAYPTGIIPAAKIDVALSAKSTLHAKFGGNIFNHQDFGKQDEENGQGLGGALGYTYHFNELKKGWLIGVRSDVWFNHVNWKDNELLESGTTDIVVLQPTVFGGYAFKLANSNFAVTPTLAVGQEWNLYLNNTHRKTGEGWIALLGLYLSYRINKK